MRRTVAFLACAALIGLTDAALQSVPLPELRGVGKIYDSGGERTDTNVVGYTVVIARKGAMVAPTWMRAVPNPHGEHFSYQPLTGNEANITVDTIVDAADDGNDVITINLNFVKSQYNDLTKMQFVLRLAVDTMRGPVDLYLFPHNDKLKDTILPKVQLLHSATYYVPEESAEPLNPEETSSGQRPVDIEHKVVVIADTDSNRPQLETMSSFIRVFEEFRPEEWIAGPDDYWLIQPKKPVDEQKKYQVETTRAENGTMVVKHKFTAQNVNRNDSGLFQFDVTVSAGSEPVYQVSTKFLLRRNSYAKNYQGVFQCSPYRTDVTKGFLKEYGLREGFELPCSRLIMLGQNHEEMTVRYRFIRDDYDNVKPLALADDRIGLNDMRERTYIINDPHNYVPWWNANDEQKRDIAVTAVTKSNGHRQESFRFRPYHPIRMINAPTVVDGDKITFHCNATWAKQLKVSRMKKSFYETFKNGLVNVDPYELKDTRNMREDWYRGVNSVENSGSDLNGERLYTRTVEFDKNKLSRQLGDERYTVACIAYNRFELVSKLLTDDYNYVDE